MKVYKDLDLIEFLSQFESSNLTVIMAKCSSLFRDSVVVEYRDDEESFIDFLFNDRNFAEYDINLDIKKYDLSYFYSELKKDTLHNHILYVFQSEFPDQYGSRGEDAYEILENYMEPAKVGFNETFIPSITIEDKGYEHNLADSINYLFSIGPSVDIEKETRDAMVRQAEIKADESLKYFEKLKYIQDDINVDFLEE